MVEFMRQNPGDGSGEQMLESFPLRSIPQPEGIQRIRRVDCEAIAITLTPA
jgi:hypothetical protein